MSDLAIRVARLGKRYRIGAKRERYKALRDKLTDAMLWPVRAARSLVHRNGNSRSAADETIWALKDVSFEVKRGEVVGVIGRNGAGKSTLLKILSRITEPTEGCVEIRGRVGSLLEVGTGFHPELTGRENIYLNGAILGMRKAEIERKFDEIVAFAEIEKFIDTMVKHYSSGMYLRLAFAVAAHLEPEILLVDEVLAVGDAAFQKKCLGKMDDVAKEGRTVLFVSHNMGAVQSLCGAGLLLDGGRLRRSGPVASVVSEYDASLRGSCGRDLGGSVRLGPALRLSRLEVSPPAVESGSPMLLHVEVTPAEATVIREMAVLVYSEYGVRVAVLDLRRKGLRDIALCNEPLGFEVHVETLPLVEGDYSLGLYIVTRDYQGNYLDLATLSVGAPKRRGDVVPYLALQRGLLELEFSVRDRTVGIIESLAL